MSENYKEREQVDGDLYRYNPSPNAYWQKSRSIEYCNYCNDKVYYYKYGDFKKYFYVDENNEYKCIKRKNKN